MKELVLNKVNGKTYILLTDNNYSKITLGDEFTIISRSEYQDCIKKSDISNLDRLLDFLKSNVESGIYIVCFTNNTLFFNSFLSTELSYYEENSKFYVSDSSLTIAKKFNLKLSKKAIATQLIVGLPYYPFNTMSMWEEINKLTIFTHLSIDDCGQLFFVNDVLDKDRYSNNNLRETVKNALTSKIQKDVFNYKNISLDVSGGIDSAVISYLLKDVTSTFSMYHSKSTENSDTKWAKFISNNLGRPLNILGSIEKSNKRFEIDSEYLGNKISDLPLMWSDTEGYINELIKHISSDTPSIHFIGIGGDDLFSPMPSAPWSIAKRGNNNYQGIKFLLRYSIYSKHSFIYCINSFFDRQSYFNDLILKINGAFSKNSKRSLLFSWNEEIVIPLWFTQEIESSLKNFLVEIASRYKVPLDNDRTKNQIIQSLIFQNTILSQINSVSPEKIQWSAPYLNFHVIEASLNLPELEKYDPIILKPFLYKIMNGVIPKELFYRGSKGDYSTTLYQGYRVAKKQYNSYFDEFELVKLGIIDANILIQELSMPTANPTRIDFFERVCNMERWLRQLKKNYGEMYEENYR